VPLLEGAVAHYRAHLHYSMRQHTSAYVSIRQHTSISVSIRPHASAKAEWGTRASTVIFDMQSSLFLFLSLPLFLSSSLSHRHL
jgi:hypothetical protein